MEALVLSLAIVVLAAFVAWPLSRRRPDQDAATD